MTNPVENFWPTNLPPAPDDPPTSLLRQQAELIGDQTANMIEGVVRTNVVDGTLWQSLNLTAENLGDYQYKLLTIARELDQDVFPLHAFGPREDQPATTITDMEQFRAWLKATLSSDDVARVISRLLKYSAETAIH